MLEYDDGYLVVGLDGELYYIEHVWTTWTIYSCYLETETIEVIQEPWDKVKREGRYEQTIPR